MLAWIDENGKIRGDVDFDSAQGTQVDYAFLVWVNDGATLMQTMELASDDVSE